LTGSKRRKEDTFGMNDDDWDVYKQIVSTALLTILLYLAFVLFLTINIIVVVIMII